MTREYYVVTLRGVPIDVSTSYARALGIAKERTVPGATAEVVACVPVQLEFELEEPTKEECTYPNCDHAKGLCFNNYEVG